MTYTPGPWKACREHEEFSGPIWEPNDEDERREMESKPFVRVCAESGYICTNHDLFVFDNAADAHLIAAAPELLAALEDAEFLLRKTGQLSGPMQDSFNRSAEDARAAIAKAKGYELTARQIANEDYGTAKTKESNV